MSSKLKQEETQVKIFRHLGCYFKMQTGSLCLRNVRAGIQIQNSVAAAKASASCQVQNLLLNLQLVLSEVVGRDALYTSFSVEDTTAY